MADRHSSVSGGGGHSPCQWKSMFKAIETEEAEAYSDATPLCGRVALKWLFTSLFTAANHSCHLFPLPLSPLCRLTFTFLFLLLLQQCPGLIAAGLGFFRHCQPMRGHLLCDSYAICLSHLCIWLFASPVFLRGFLPHAFAATLSFELPQNEHLRS